MSSYDMKTTTGPYILCPMVIFYGSLPRPARATPAATEIELETALESARKDTIAELSKRRIYFGLRHLGGTKGHENVY